MSKPNPKTVATLVLPGTDDPAKVMSTYSVTWSGKRISKFREVKIHKEVDSSMALPTLYLHFLDEEFRIPAGGLDQNLRAGNDMAEVVIKLPSKYVSEAFLSQCGECRDQIEIIVQTLRRLGDVIVSDVDNESCSIESDALFFGLATARPKAGISLDKKAFGIPEKAEQYLFVNNHACVSDFSEEVKAAFSEAIEKLAESEATADCRKMAVFLKLFYEGGFAYNEKVVTSAKSYLPRNVGTAAMSVVPAFEGQTGIGTGHPYVLSEPFLRFVDTVPISIEGIRSMSDFHGRYGMCFTRTIFLWEGDSFETDGALDFCSIVPHGGFFYVPATMEEHERLGGLVYAFGESVETSGQELSA